MIKDQQAEKSQVFQDFQFSLDSTLDIANLNFHLPILWFTYIGLLFTHPTICTLFCPFDSGSGLNSVAPDIHFSWFILCISCYSTNSDIVERHRCVPVFNIVSVFKTTSTSAVTPPSFKTGIVKKKKITLIYFVPACVHLRVCSRSKALMWNSENSLWELVSSFYLVGPGNWTQLVRLCSGHLYLLTHLTYKIWFFFF